MTSSREQFDGWFSSYVVEIPEIELPEMDNGEYVQGDKYDEQFYVMLQAMWMAWQASRQCIEVELPPTEYGEMKKNAAIREVRAELQNAGIKIKGA